MAEAKKKSSKTTARSKKATKAKKSTPARITDTTSTRVVKVAKTSKKPVQKRQRIRMPKWLARIKWPKWLQVIGGYFTGSWRELLQVRWPDRRASWSLTIAVIIFSLFFAGVIVALDYVFNYLFKEVLL